jgi:HEAT repeat protein
MCHRPWVLLVLASLLAALAAPVARADSLSEDLEVLRAARVDSDGPALLTFFKKRTLSEVTRKKIADHILLLGDAEYSIREKATGDLIDLGAVARPQLAQALRSTDLEVRKRARRALDAIGSASAETNLLPAAARVLAHRKPAGAAQVLLDFLPNIEETETAEEVARTVALVALDKDGKPEPAVLLALSDRQWIKRYAAGEALARIAAQRASVRKLLKDTDAGVGSRFSVELLVGKEFL